MPSIDNICFVLLLLVSTCLIQNSNGQSCQKAIGESCQRSAECSGGVGVTCARSPSGGANRICQCHEAYYQVTSSAQAKSCVLAPSKVGASCQNAQNWCRPPLKCVNGVCQCLNAEGGNGNGVCSQSAQHGQRCGSHAECSRPFMACVGGKCSCIGNTNLNAKSGECEAAAHCPDNSAPVTANNALQKCTRWVTDADIVSNTFNTGTLLDSCPQGQYCVTDGVSSAGFCCRQRCPLGNSVANSPYTCSSGNSSNCPQETHYCHRLVGNGFSSTVCCRRACTEPKPIYIKGQCYQASGLNRPCFFNEQCDLGQSMKCVCVDAPLANGGCNKGLCQCNSGYTNSTSDPTRQNYACVKSCGSNTVPIDNLCFNTAAAVGASCQLSSQCAANSECVSGICQCKCNFQTQGSTCVQPATTLAPGGSTAGNSILGGLNLQNILGGLLGGGNGGGGGGLSGILGK